MDLPGGLLDEELTLDAVNLENVLPVGIIKVSMFTTSLASLSNRILGTKICMSTWSCAICFDLHTSFDLLQTKTPDLGGPGMEFTQFSDTAAQESEGFTPLTVDGPPRKRWDSYSAFVITLSTVVLWFIRSSPSMTGWGLWFLNSKFHSVILTLDQAAALDTHNINVTHKTYKSMSKQLVVVRKTLWPCLDVQMSCGGGGKKVVH